MKFKGEQYIKNHQVYPLTSYRWLAKLNGNSRRKYAILVFPIGCQLYSTRFDRLHRAYLNPHPFGSRHWIKLMEDNRVTSRVQWKKSGYWVLWTVNPEVPGSSPEWEPIFHEVRPTAQSLLEPSSFWGSTLSISLVVHQDSGWESSGQFQIWTVFAVNN